MTSEMLLEEYERLKAEYKELLDDYTDLDNKLRTANKEIDRLRSVSSWIPCSEKLPRVDRKVLIYDKTVEAPYEGCLMRDGLWTDYDFYISPENVTHWMHLPEPPGGEES